MYELGEDIGEGSFGSVILAYDKFSRQKVAVKLIDKKIADAAALRRIQREVRVLCSLKHENIVQVYDIFDTPAQMCIVMEYMNGGTLDEYIGDLGSISERVKTEQLIHTTKIHLSQPGSPYPQANALLFFFCFCSVGVFVELSLQSAPAIIGGLLDALAYLHERNIVHRDLKPENTLFSTDPLCVKIADFGFVGSLDTDEEGEAKLLSTLLGTWNYVSPEQIKREPYGPAVDIWATGVTMYEILSGKLPFDGTTAYTELSTK